MQFLKRLFCNHYLVETKEVSRCTKCGQNYLNGKFGTKASRFGLLKLSDKDFYKYQEFAYKTCTQFYGGYPERMEEMAEDSVPYYDEFKHRKGIK